MRILSDYIPDPTDGSTLVPRVCVEYGIAEFTSEPYSLSPEVRVIEIDDSWAEVVVGYEVA